jgi:DNA-binding beta-propeller fold protein YncE
MNEKITVLDAKTGDKVGEVNLGGEPEAAASDGNGTLYVNLEDKGALAVVDARTLKVTRTYPIEGCTAPHSLSFDRENRRVLIGCVDGFAALDANTGKVVAHSLMCSGVDSGGFDPQRHLIFESCGEGVISVLRQVSPDYYQLVDTVKTQLRARTMTFDVKTKKIYLPTADVDLVPNPDPKADSPFRQKLTPGSFRVLVVEP